MVYKDQLIGKKVIINGQEIEVLDNDDFYKWIQFTENKLAGGRRAALKKIGDLNHKLTYEDIIKKYFTAEDVLRNMKSTYSVFDKHQRQEGKVQETSFDSVRNMNLSFNKFDGYTNSERDFVQSRLLVYKEFYKIEAPNDEFQILDLIDMELDMMQLKTFIKLNKNSKNEEEKLKQMRLQYSKAQQDLNLKKQQRDNTKDKSDDTASISKLVNDMSKPIDELQKEANELKQKKEKFLKERSKRK